MYHILAKTYDNMQEIDYKKFVDYYQKLFEKFGCQPELVLDLGCGTGNITLEMADRGYDMIGLDASPEMLEIAMEKARERNREILFLQQDMSAFELYGTVGAMVCALDGVNYLTEEGQLKEMLRLLHYYLDPGGIFIFDLNTEYKFKHILDGKTFIYDTEDAYCAWSNEYDEEEKICYFDLNFFFKNPDGSFTRRDEYQEERSYSIEEIKEAIRDCNLTCLGIFDNLSMEPAKEDSMRIFVVVQR